MASQVQCADLPHMLAHLLGSATFSTPYPSSYIFADTTCYACAFSTSDGAQSDQQ